MNAVSWRIDRGPDETRIVMTGELTEFADFGPLAKDELKPPVAFDLGEVQRINSCGLRAWIQLVLELNQRGIHIALERCGPAVVGQLNLISNFAGANGVVRSAYAPYYCTSCDKEHFVLVDRERWASVEEVKECPECGSEAEFSDLIDLYFSFWNDA